MNKLLTPIFLLMSCFFLAGSSLSSAEITQLTDQNFKQIISGSKPVVLDVYTDWCGPCKQLAPVLKELNNEMGDRFIFAKMNAEQQSKLADHFKISAYPTIIFIKDGKEVGRIMGFFSKQALAKEIENRLR